MSAEADRRSAARPAYDDALQAVADYVLDYDAGASAEALQTARHCLADSIGCALLALDYPACRKLLGPTVPGAEMTDGVPIPGTGFHLEPVQAAFDIGAMVRWLDFNDTWLAAEWGHPSDNIGGILAAADHRARRQEANGDTPLTMRTVLDAMIKAHEIQGVTALANAFNDVGLDHVLLVRVASAAVCCRLLGGTRDEILSALSHAWADGGALRCYRHAPNTGSRKSWAAGDATSRGLRLALIALSGEMGYPSALTAPHWGFQDVLFRGRDLQYQRPFGSYVMEHVLFKIAYPAEFHAQTAVEAAVALHQQVADRIDDIERVVIETQRSALRIIDKTGPLDNPADRDHCLQYMVAVALLTGQLSSKDYEDAVAADPRIDTLRERMQVVENERFSREYHEADKRSIGNAVQVFFADGSTTDQISIDYPIGHRRRREEGLPLLWDKFQRNIARALTPERCEELCALCTDQERLEGMPVHEFMNLLAGQNDVPR